MRAATMPELNVPASTLVRFCNYPAYTPQGDALPALHDCHQIGGHVIAANGELAFCREDFTLHGPFPFRWQRYYRQGQERDIGLGPGWRHTLSEHLQLPETRPGKQQKLLLHTADGRLVAFDLPAIGNASYNRSERLHLLRQSLHSFRLSAFDTPDKIFRADGAGKTAPLSEIRDAFGNTLSVDYRNGHAQKIVTSWGTTLEFEHENGRLARITDRRSDKAPALADYQYDAEGCLVATRNRLVQERFTVSGGQISSLTNHELGRLTFTYDRFQRVRQVCRSEDAVQPNDIEDDRQMVWNLRWRSGTQRCIVTTRGQCETHLRFDTCGNLIESTRESRSQRWRFDLYRNLCHSVDALGQDTLYRYDAYGRLRRRTRNGVNNHYIYDDEGRLIAAGNLVGDTGTRVWKYRYAATDRRPTVIIDPAGGVWKCEYDERGQLRTLTDPEHGQLSLEWNAECQLSRLVHGDRVLTWEYDSQGNIVAQTGTRLAARKWLYDQHCKLERLTIGDYTLTVSTDEYGRPCTLSHNSEPVLQWQYDGCGRVRCIQQFFGPALNLGYNPQGKLSTLRCDDRQYRWRYNQFGQLASFDDERSPQLEWHHAAGGQLREFRDCDSHWYLQYNDAGHLVQIRNNSGLICQFHFDALGRLTQAANEYCNLRYRYDARGLLIAEHHDVDSENSADNVSINHSYDSRGWLKSSCSDCINIAFTFSPAGRLYGIDTNGAMAVRSEIPANEQKSNDQPHREFLSLGSNQVIKTFQQGVLKSLDFGKTGELEVPPTSNAIQGLLPVLDLFSPAPRSAETARDAHGNIIATARIDSGRAGSSPSTYRYQYDGWGLLHSVECGDFTTWLRYDPFGRRLMKISTHRHSGRQRRIASHWSGTGLWSETNHHDSGRSSTIFLHHPNRGIALGRVSFQLAGNGDTTGIVPEHREFFVAGDDGQLLALLPDTPTQSDPDTPIVPAWRFKPEKAGDCNAPLLCPGSYQGKLGTYDGDTRLFYRHFRHFIPELIQRENGTRVPSLGAPLDGGQRYLVTPPEKRDLQVPGKPNTARTTGEPQS
ncbi:DUF6531 domain-containing protein [Microbulbifer hydrolyticus]|uniref:YD repeat-containing protein n=1 Tax=Microbulbifer hydrolyticus TaxID=48074 RepID=A0A6P1T738_9GAMM|nr:DUF6531 domain-containing protein [Microbulbifer hydrolyticus]MBB5211408.1 YD repeat-containing protein [Microbulbifer hydrolyticus]QHQ37837.1 hypothetical protein GTQ55_01730 [Microbulbifer hydrolyticus]